MNVVVTIRVSGFFLFFVNVGTRKGKERAKEEVLGHGQLGEDFGAELRVVSWRSEVGKSGRTIFSIPLLTFSHVLTCACHQTRRCEGSVKDARPRCHRA